MKYYEIYNVEMETRHRVSYLNFQKKLKSLK